MAHIISHPEATASPAELRDRLQCHADALAKVSPGNYRLVRTAWTRLSDLAERAATRAPGLVGDLNELQILAGGLAEEMLFDSVNGLPVAETGRELIGVCQKIAGFALRALTPGDARVLRDTADVLAHRVAHARINRGDLHLALREVAVYQDAQTALDAYARHVDASGGDVRWLSSYAHVRPRVEVVAELRDAADAIEAVDAVVAVEPLSAAELAALSEGQLQMAEIAARYGIDAVVTGR